MQLSLLLILLGLIIGILFNGPLGVVFILIGLFLLLWPSVRAR